MNKTSVILDIEEGKYPKVLFRGEKYPKTVFNSIAPLEDLKKWKAAGTMLDYVIVKKPAKKPEADGTYKEYWNITSVKVSGTGSTPTSAQQPTQQFAPQQISKLTQAEQDKAFIDLVQKELGLDDESMELELQSKAQ